MTEVGDEAPSYSYPYQRQREEYGGENPLLTHWNLIEFSNAFRSEDEKEGIDDEEDYEAGFH